MSSRLARRHLDERLIARLDRRRLHSCDLVASVTVLKLIAYRLVQMVVALVIVTTLTFALLTAAGGDALTALRDDPAVSETTLQNMRHVYGLDQPLPIRYARWLAAAARGNLGESFFYHAPVASLIVPRLWNTALLAVIALLLAWVIALALGMLAAHRPDSWIDRLCETLILLSASTPRIVLALVALAFVSRAGLATGGASGQLTRVLLPACVLAAPLVALFMAQVREGVGAALNEEFVLVARAKGLRERDVVLRHALRAALNPLITIFGYSLGGVMSGSVIVETVLGWPGLGALSVNAVRNRDVPLLLGVVMITSAAVFIGNLIADILLYLSDPRLRQAHNARMIR